MKKTLALILALTLVSVCFIFSAGAADTNLALNKPYTLKGLYFAEGATEAAWPDTDNKEATDGIKTTEDEVKLTDPAFFGLNVGASDMETGDKSNVTVDLGSVCSITGFSASVLGNAGSGITAPKSVTFSYSTDGTNYTAAGEGTYDGDTTQYVVLNSELTLTAAVEAQYVKIEFEHSTNWIFVSEVEVFGTAADGGDESSEATSTTETSSAADSSSGTTPTGDAGYIALAVIAVVALAGAIIVKKVR